MTTVTETDMKELKDLIIVMNERLMAIQEESRIDIAVTNEKLDTIQTGVIAVTNEKLASLNGRLDTIQTSVNNKFLESAVSGMAQYIIIGDNDLLILNTYQGIPIITPAEFGVLL